MKMIFKIAKTELRNLFYSPVAWFLTIAFIVQCAVFYTNPLYSGAKWQDVLLRNTPSFKNWGPKSMTTNIFLSPDGIFNNVLQNLYLFVPLLSMGLISREINTGTIKLLYSSPVKVRGIVLGKYFAIMLYNLLLLLILGIFMVSAAFNIKSVDYGLLLSASVGFYLLVCAYSAIGLFMSSLTIYQIVSAIGSFVTIFILSRIGGLWQKIEFVRDLTYFLSMSGRTGKMLRGLITTKDVLYFVIIVYMFLGFTLLKLKGGQESKPWYVKARGYVFIVVLALLIGYISSRPIFTGYWDTTAGQTNTLHPRTQEIVKELGKDPLEVTLYTNLLGGSVTNGLPEQRNAYLSDLWEPYLRFKPDIQFKYVNYYHYDSSMDNGTLRRSFPGKTSRQIGEQLADAYDIKFSRFSTPEAIVPKTVDLRSENYRLVMQVKYKGQTTFLRTFSDNIVWPEEEHVAAAFKRLLQAKLPKLLFVTGDLERNIYKRGEREYRDISIEKLSRLSLLNLGFDSDTLSLNTGNIPPDITALVLADPKTSLSAASLSKMEQYIDNGGNMLILGEPGKQEMLNPLLQRLGVQLMDGTMIQPSKEEMPHMATPYVTTAGLDLAEERLLLLSKKSGDSLKVLMQGATGIAYSTRGAFTATPLLMTVGQQTWLKAGRLVTDSTPPEYSPQEGDIKGSFPTALALTRQVNDRQQRIVVCSDADFMSNLRSGSSFFGRAICSWLDKGQFPIYTPRPDPKDNLLTITAPGANVLKIVYVWVLPALVLLLGSILLIRRKRK